MNIDERVKKAYALHHSGYNCAQAVLGHMWIYLI